MDCKSLYLSIQEQLLRIASHSLKSENLTQVASAHCFVEDYKKWADFIGYRYNNELFTLAISEYETAIVFCLQSLYKQAFTAMRACLEHTLFGIQLSTNLYQYLLWKNGTRDVYWSNLIDQDTGLFSKVYIDAFCPDMYEVSTLVGTLAKGLYRECSEYIHGNYKIAYSFPEQLEYDEEKFQQFFEKIESLKYIIEFSLFIRFQGEFAHKDKILFETQIMEYLGHIQEIIEFVSISHKGE